MDNYAVVCKVSGRVENVVVWDGVSEWDCGNDFVAVKSNEAHIGMVCTDGEFVEELQQSNI